jgi:hypothetical protein
MQKQKRVIADLIDGCCKKLLLPCRHEYFSDWTEKIRLFRAEEILPMTVPWDTSGLQFRVGPGLGRGTRAFYSVNCKID